MELLLRLLNARTLLAVGGTAALFVLADRFQHIPRGWYESRRAAAERGSSPLAADLAKDLERRESAELRALHRKVTAEISAARAKGFDVARLQRMADGALGLDSPAYRAAAIERLNRLRLVVPQTVEPFVPAAAGDEPSDGPPTPRSSASKRR